MKKFVILSAVFLLAAIILPSGSASGKYNVSKPTLADGNPLPPFPPKPPTTLMADGNPLPPFPPKPPTTLMADGNPLPPFPPNPSATSHGPLA